MPAPEWITIACPDLSQTHADAAAERQTRLTKPTGSLGRIETVAIELAAIQRTAKPRADRVPIIVFAGDHGAAGNGISAYPQEVTIAMMANFANGGAAISVLAKELDATLEVVDAGTLADRPMPGIIIDKPRRGSRDFSIEPALTETDLAYALAAGKRAVERALLADPDILIFGEMGIGNTTAASAIAASLLRLDTGELTGSGTGLDHAGRTRKTNFINAALKKHDLRNDQVNAGTVLRTVGGFEIAALTGAIVAAAQAGKAVLIDGFIVTVAALAATRINPSCRGYLLFSHRSAEQGHRHVLDALDAEPLLDLNLRLGEGSGAAIALPLLRLACALHNRMATFEEAAVPDRDPDRET